MRGGVLGESLAVVRPGNLSHPLSRVVPVAAFLALVASIVWGVADFLGGASSRRLPTAVVLVVSQAAGLAAIGVVLALGGWSPPGA